MPAKKKQIAYAIRSRKVPAPEQPQVIDRKFFRALVSALQDAAPIKSSEHFSYKDAQHKECVIRVGQALSLTVQRAKGVEPENYVSNFLHLVRGEF